MTGVTLITGPADRADDLTAEDYRTIYEELRGVQVGRGGARAQPARSLRQFIELIGSEKSPAWWSQYESGVKHLDWRTQNELRRAVGLRELAPSVAAALGDVTDDAEVWRIGAGEADRVILIGAVLADRPLLRLVFDVRRADGAETQEAAAGNVTAITGRSGTGRRAYFRPCLPAELEPVVQARMEALGLSGAAFWRAVLEQVTEAEDEAGAI